MILLRQDAWLKCQESNDKALAMNCDEDSVIISVDIIKMVYRTVKTL